MCALVSNCFKLFFHSLHLFCLISLLVICEALTCMKGTIQIKFDWLIENCTYYKKNEWVTFHHWLKGIVWLLVSLSANDQWRYCFMQYTLKLNHLIGYVNTYEDKQQHPDCCSICTVMKPKTYKTCFPSREHKTC